MKKEVVKYNQKYLVEGGQRLIFIDRKGMQGKNQIFTKSGAVAYINEYYPFGLQNQQTSSTQFGSKEQRYKFGSKELMKDFNIEQQDFDARLYNPQIARFLRVDPLADQMVEWSPYCYTYDNPINFTDPTGMSPEPTDITDVINVDTKNKRVTITKTNDPFDILVVNGVMHTDANGNVIKYDKGELSEDNFKANGYSVWHLEGVGMGAVDAGLSTLVGMKLFSMGANALRTYAAKKIAQTGTSELFSFSAKAASHMANPARTVPVQILEQAIKGGTAVADPKGSRALLYTVEMVKNGKVYNLEVLYDKVTNAVWHFKYAPKIP